VLLRLVANGDGTFATEEVWRNSKVLRTKFANVAVKGDAAYGLSDGILECTDLQSGRRIWKDGRYRHGQILRVGDLLLVLTESGEVVLVEATPERPNSVLGRFQAIEGMTWNNLALYGRYLLVRNAEQAACYVLP
jgi:outer membrane protein assembly factor BamB